jgi:hypothetical protein
MAPTNFSDFPVEMIGNIFAYIRLKADMGQTCLVSRAWRDIMAPMMWETFVTDVRPTGTKMMATLLHPNSGISRHVRRLKVMDVYGEEEDSGQHMSRFIAALPRDQLRSVQAVIAMSKDTLQVILQRHSQLELFDVPVLDNEHLTIDGNGRTVMMPHLGEVFDTTLWLRDSSSATYEHLQHVFECSPKLRRLTLRPDYGEDYTGVRLNKILAFATPGSAMFANLSSLFLESMMMSTSDATVFAHLNMQKLKNLTLIRCDDVHLFLDELSRYFSSHSGALSTILIVQLEYSEEGHPPDTITAVENLLKVSLKLYSIELAINNFKLLSKDSILPHKETLCSLMVDTGEYDVPRYYEPEDLREIVQASQKL